MPKRTSTKPAAPAVITPQFVPPELKVFSFAPFPVTPVTPVTAPVVVIDPVAIRAAERAACATFVEGLDIGSESIRHAIAKALRERK